MLYSVAGGWRRENNGLQVPFKYGRDSTEYDSTVVKVSHHGMLFYHMYQYTVYSIQ